MSGCYLSVCSGIRGRNFPLVQVPALPAPQLHKPLVIPPAPPGGFAGLLYRFEARINSSWRAALFLKWYAVLINVVEACFAINEMANRFRLRHNDSSGFVDRNLHSATEMVTLLANVLAIAGLLWPNTVLLLPYFALHLITLVLELNYLITRAAFGQLGRKSSGRSFATNGGRGPAATTSTWRSLATLAFVAFNLLIMIGAKFATTAIGATDAAAGRPQRRHSS